jgi:hypothetical protein
MISDFGDRGLQPLLIGGRVMAVEETLADDRALRLIGAMKITKGEVKKLELLTLRKVAREARLLAAECAFYEGVRLLQGGAKSQHRKERRSGK